LEETIVKYGSKKEAKKWSMDALRGGLVATIPTPFHDDTMEIHEKDLRSLTRYCIETKNDAIFILGNVGEFYCLTQEERKKVAEIVIDEVQGEIAVIVQTSHHCSRDVIDLSRHAQEAGADLVATLSPYFQCANDQSVEEWWHETFADLEIGAVFYDSPLSHLVTAQTLGRIAREIPNIVGVKDGRPDQMWCWEAEREANYEIWVSNPLEDHWPYEMRIMKNPVLCCAWHMYLLQEPGNTPIRDYTDLIMAGKWEEGLKKYDEIEPGRQLLNDFFWHNYRQGVYVVGYWKYWMQMKGVISGHRVRTPLVNMTPDEEKWLEERFKLLQEGKHYRSKGELTPYPLQQGGAAPSGRLAI
jgi:dihydrodipicolinate synthase/N-acetylneuraminate lyase